MSYRVEYEPEAVADLKQLPVNIRKRIVNKINWLVQNFEQIQPIPLTENLSGFFKLRVGDYRVIYDVDRSFRVITVDRVGHRRDIYG
ncbi:type II toxin-antitoxin system RelE/ParE family toxin [Candidatus Synechococcus calcipolaris G9]|uniref:Type II toxin-antitoxin system RelE/ParE family toxin n=1 Tax=Candidatus Synechococcus calcipolaris G9 TaxID=1497997 RepID=A0ABT6F197_9SYNE|nr:type II toxin-antitoxin system RelE/ParE family toxin [Candidatus Synechococcus calcipolaris]MDG2991558.1 type II toxin-antitoxin system RelE/ParE family toxin [Candidatus Synechococcus calcipolaris G9]